MKIVYEKLYLFFTMGDKIFRDTVLGCPTKSGVYIIQKKESSPYHIFKFTPPTVDTLDYVEFEPFKLIRYYPMFSKSDSFENYISLMKARKQDEIDYYQDKIKNLEEQLEKDYICEDV